MGIHLDSLQKLAMTGAVIVSGLSIGYYFGIFLPDMELKNVKLEMQQQEALAKDRTPKAVEASATHDNGMLAKCFFSAEMTNVAAWSNACKDQMIGYQTELANCDGDAVSCHKLYDSKILNSQGSNCMLKNGSKKIDAEFSQAKEDCSTRYGS